MKPQLGGTVASVCAVFFCLFSRVSAQAPEPGPSPSPSGSDLLRTLKTCRSHKRGFYIVSKDREQNVDLMRWADNAADRIEQLTHLRIPTGGRFVTRIVVRDVVPGIPPSAGVSQMLRGNTLEQRLTIVGYDEVEPVLATEGLCHLLLSRVCVARWIQEHLPREEETAPADSPHVRTVPFWLSLGLARNMGVANRAADSSLVLDRWQQGRLPTLAAFLRAGVARPTGGQPLAAHERAMCGAVVAWLCTYTAEDGVFDAVADRLSQGLAVTADWLSQAMPRIDNIAEADAAWQGWVRRQRRTVYATNSPYASHVLGQLRAALLLCRGESGIPVSESLPARMRLGDLTAYRNEKWIGDVAICKAKELSVLAVGRDEECASTIAAYCRFLRGLREGAEDAVLQEWLHEADCKLESLTKSRSLKK